MAAPRGAERLRVKGVVIASVTHDPPDRVGLRRVTPGLLAAAVLAGVLIGVGTWELVDRAVTDNSAKADATALIDELSVAVERHDADAVAALVTPDIVVRSGAVTVTGVRAIRGLASTPGAKLDRTAPVSVNGDFATTFMDVTAPGGLGHRDAVAVLQLEDGKVARLWAFVLGSTPPLDNAATP